MRHLYLMVTAAGLTVAAPAAAQQAESADAAVTFPRFDAVDANLDGAISRSEFDRELSELEEPERLFAEADADGDGQISRQEWADWREQRTAAAPDDDEEAALLEPGQEIELAVTEETLQGRYNRDADLVGLDGNRLSFGLLLSDEREAVINGEIMAPGLLAGMLPDFVTLSLGGTAMIGLLDEPDDDIIALAPGAEARVRLPVPFDTPMFGVGRIFYAPDVVTFGDADRVIDFEGRFEVQFLENTVGFVGYRVLNFEREDQGDDKVVNNLQAGLRFVF